jgi:hypothetical protein
MLEPVSFSSKACSNSGLGEWLLDEWWWSRSHWNRGASPRSGCASFTTRRHTICLHLYKQIIMLSLSTATETTILTSQSTCSETRNCEQSHKLSTETETTILTSQSTCSVTRNCEQSHTFLQVLRSLIGCETASEYKLLHLLFICLFTYGFINAVSKLHPLCAYTLITSSIYRYCTTLHNFKFIF